MAVSLEQLRHLAGLYSAALEPPQTKDLAVVIGDDVGVTAIVSIAHGLSVSIGDDVNVLPYLASEISIAASIGDDVNVTASLIVSATALQRLSYYYQRMNS